MGLFRRSKGTKTSAGRAAPAAVALDATSLDDRSSNDALAEAVRVPAVASEARLGGGALHQDDSDIFVCDLPTTEAEERDRAAQSGKVLARGAEPSVTLYVYGWHNVEPGPLSWPFPSLRAALDAVRTMRNAVQWCIVSGRGWDSVDDARAEGAVLVEQLG